MKSFKKIRYPRRKGISYRAFLKDYVIPYLEECGYLEDSKYFFKSRYYNYMKGDDGVLIGKKLFNGFCIIIVYNRTKVLGTISYTRIYPEYHRYLFYTDFFAIYNKEYGEEIREFIGFKDYYKTLGRFVYGRQEEVPRGSNPVSRRFNLFKGGNESDV